jgi:uridine kinase
MQEMLRAQRARYPLMEPEDAVVLIHQRAFGSGPMTEGGEAALENLREELKGVPKDASAPLFESLGADTVRMNLASPDFPRPETAAGMYVASAKIPDRGAFQRELDALVEAWPECAGTVTAYRARGCPKPSHSRAFRAAYRPAYRVVSAKYRRFFEVFRRIDELWERPRLLVAIDGRCGSGKSSLSQLISSACGAVVLHMDDFFQTERQKAAGERAPIANIDGARLMAALSPLSKGEPFEFSPYDCLMGEFLPPRVVHPRRMAVVEGSYCLHPSIRLDYDVKIFLTVDYETQLARIKVRNPDLYDRFVAEWIPNEEKYFKAFGIQQECLTADGRALSEPPEGEEP